MYFILNNMDDNVEDKLDDNWIIDFENKDKLYQDFYKDNVYFTNINFIYVNQVNEIEKIINEKFIMSTPNYITREEIIGILKQRSVNYENNKKYTILSILKYNISLNVEDVLPFLKNLNAKSYTEDFLASVKNIDTIKFDKTINMFQDLNDLFFIFYEKSDKKEMKNITKKVFIKSKYNKTIRK
jgi:hypothetical protein